MELIHVKLNNGEDIIGYGLVDSSNDTIIIEHPISVKVDPSLGVYATKWLHFSERNNAVIPIVKVMSVDKASQSGSDCYEDFMHNNPDNSMTAEELSDSVNELEDMFTTMLEAKISTKH